MTVETVRRLTYDGFSYSCRTVMHPNPSTNPVLLVGGAFMDMCGWREMESHMTPLTSVITADLPGQGAADRLPPSRGAEFLTASIRHMLHEIDAPRVNVVGTSYGAALAYVFAQRFPSRINRMVLLGVAPEIPRWHRGAMKSVEAHITQGRIEDFGRYVISIIVNRDPSCTVRNRDLVIRALEDYYSRPNSNAHLMDVLQRACVQKALPPGGLVGVPTLVVSGEYDHATPPREGRRVASMIGEAWFATVKEADHAVHAERPAEVADLIMRFFQNEPLQQLAYLDTVESMSPSGFGTEGDEGHSSGERCDDDFS
ncbi:alpha/beta fold hydrolase [Streptomyces sp. NBC_00388]|uniref:alpha/beta fold hydrolase n=1 Tax=Streptomyces sp. NBC_00388 TaxID=2975735 RepID=UPI002E23905B